MVLWTLGCSDVIGVDGAEVVVLSAVVDAQGHVLEASFERAAFVPGGHHAVSFLLDPESFLDPLGRPIDLRTLGTRMARQPASGDECGYCAAPARVGPQVLFPGDACPIPEMVPALVDGEPVSPEWLVLTRTEILLRAQGSCTSSDEAPDRRPLQLRPLIPASGDLLDAIVPDVVELSPSGDVLFLHESVAAWFETSGERVVRTDLPFRGPVVSALPWGDDFLVASWDRSKPGYTAFFRFRSDLGFEELHLLDPLADDELRVIKLRPGPAGKLLLLGRAGYDRGAILSPEMGAAVCDVNETLLDCRFLGDGRQLPLPAQEASLGVSHPSGVSLAMDATGDGFAGPVARGDGLQRVSVFLDTWQGPGEAPTRSSIGGSIQPRLLGDRVWACMSHGSTAWVVTATIGVQGVGEFEVAHAFEGLCSGFAEAPTDPGHLFLWANAWCWGSEEAPCRTLLRLDEAGRVEDLGPSPSTPGLESTAFVSLEGHGGWVLATEPSQTTHRVGPDGSSERLFGAPSTPSYTIQTGAEAPDEVLFTPTPPIELVRVSKPELGVRRETLSFPPSDRVTTSSWDTARNELVIGGFDPQFRGFLRRVSLDEPMHHREVALPEGVGRVLALTEIVPGVLYAVADKWTLLRIEGEQSEQVSIDWDDPATTEVEPEPEPPAECDSRFAVPDMGRRTWAHIDANHGIAYLVGCGAVVARVPVRGPARRLTFPLSILGAKPEDQASFTTVRVLNPGWIAIGAREHRIRSRDLPFVMSLKATGPTVSVSMHPAFESYPTQRSMGQNPGDVVDLIGGAGSLGVLCAQTTAPKGLFDRPDSETRLVRFSSSPAAAVSLLDGSVIVGTAYGRLFGLVPQP